MSDADYISTAPPYDKGALTGAVVGDKVSTTTHIALTATLNVSSFPKRRGPIHVGC